MKIIPIATAASLALVAATQPANGQQTPTTPAASSCTAQFSGSSGGPRTWYTVEGVDVLTITAGNGKPGDSPPERTIVLNPEGVSPENLVTIHAEENVKKVGGTATVVCDRPDGTTVTHKFGGAAPPPQ